jgi:hypothetical protein
MELRWWGIELPMKLSLERHPRMAFLTLEPLLLTGIEADRVLKFPLALPIIPSVKAPS